LSTPKDRLPNRKDIKITSKNTTNKQKTQYTKKRERIEGEKIDGKDE
jgi:hypothetical protein